MLTRRAGGRTSAAVPVITFKLSRFAGSGSTTLRGGDFVEQSSNCGYDGACDGVDMARAHADWTRHDRGERGSMPALAQLNELNAMIRQTQQFYDAGVRQSDRASPSPAVICGEALWTRSPLL
jgi:hypothetical protein